LLNTQVLIFEALAKLSPKGSVQKDVLVETASMLKNKNGVESIDVNHFIELLFEKAGYQSQDLDEPLIENISIKETFSEMDSIEELVDVILEKAHKAKKKKKSFPDLNKDGEVTKADILVGRGVIKAETEVEEEEPKIEEDSEEQQTETVEAVEELEEQETQEKEVAEKEPEESKTPSSDEIMSSFKDFEDILNSINFEDIMDDPGDEEEEDPDEEAEEAEEDAAEEETEE
jgi:hypothetical protein